MAFSLAFADPRNRAQILIQNPRSRFDSGPYHQFSLERLISIIRSFFGDRAASSASNFLCNRSPMPLLPPPFERGAECLNQC